MLLLIDWEAAEIAGPRTLLSGIRTQPVPHMLPPGEPRGSTRWQVVQHSGQSMCSGGWTLLLLCDLLRGPRARGPPMGACLLWKRSVAVRVT